MWVLKCALSCAISTLGAEKSRGEMSQQHFWRGWINELFFTGASAAFDASFFSFCDGTRTICVSVRAYNAFYLSCIWTPNFSLSKQTAMIRITPHYSFLARWLLDLPFRYFHPFEFLGKSARAGKIYSFVVLISIARTQKVSTEDRYQLFTFNCLVKIHTKLFQVLTWIYFWPKQFIFIFSNTFFAILALL